jgi:hypothetical protein
LELNKPYSDNLKIAKNNMQNCIKTSWYILPQWYTWEYTSKNTRWKNRIKYTILHDRKINRYFSNKYRFWQ